MLFLLGYEYFYVVLDEEIEIIVVIFNLGYLFKSNKEIIIKFIMIK